MNRTLIAIAHISENTAGRGSLRQFRLGNIDVAAAVAGVASLFVVLDSDLSVLDARNIVRSRANGAFDIETETVTGLVGYHFKSIKRIAAAAATGANVLFLEFDFTARGAFGGADVLAQSTLVQARNALGLPALNVRQLARFAA